MNGSAFTMILMIVSSSYGLSKQSDESLRSLNNEFNDNDRDYNRETFGDGDLSDRVVIQSTRSDDPAIWFDQEMPAFQFIHQLTLDNERYIIARIRRSRRKRSINRLREDRDVSLLRRRSDVKFAIQERAHIRKPKTLDPKWTNLWYLNGEIIPSMRIEEVWNEGYSGQGITVAVLDDGLQTNHPDLAANTDTTNDIDIYGYDNDPYPPSDSSHGTNVGGLIAAVKDNNICTVGVAFNSTLIGVRILGDFAITDSEEAQALSHYRTNVDIYSNSWGPTDGTGFKKPETLTLAALKDGVTLGRNGKGSIYLFASGNGGTADNCNADGYTNSIYTIAVTSVQIGRNAWYSEVCAAALTAAYGGSEDDKYLTTTFMTSSCGSGGIQGTSYSTPMVSGIIALTLEANNELTWRDVQHLIVWSSSRHNFTDTYSNWTTNGAGKEFSQVMGFGLIDAKEMLDQAKQWNTVPLQQNCSVSSTMPNGATLSDDISVTTNDCTSLQFIEHVTVDVTFSYSRFRGLTELYLVSPSGTKSHLLNYRYQDAVDNTAAGSLTWQFMSVHFWWENPIGTWNLEIASKDDSLSTVSIDAWSIKIYGTETDPRPEILTTTDESSTNGLITTTMKEASTSEYSTSAVLTSESVTTTSDATSRSILLTTTDAKLTSAVEITTSRSFTSFDAESTTSKSKTTSGAESTASGSFTTSGAESTTSRSMTTSAAESTVSRSMTTSGAESSTSGSRTPSGDESTSSRSMPTSGAESSTSGSRTPSGDESTSSRSMPTSGAESSTSGSRTPSGDESTSSRSMPTSGAESSTSGSRTPSGDESTSSRSMPTSGAESSTSGSRTPSGDESTSSRSMPTSGAESSTSSSITTRGAQSTTSKSKTTSGAESTASGSFTTSGAESTTSRSMRTSAAESTVSRSMTTSGAESSTSGSRTPSGDESTSSRSMPTSGAESSTSSSLTTRGAQSNTSGPMTTSGAEFFTSRSSTTSSAESTTNRSMTTSVAESSTSRSITTSGAESSTSRSMTTSGAESTTSRSITTSSAESTTSSSMKSSTTESTSHQATTNQESDTSQVINRSFDSTTPLEVATTAACIAAVSLVCAVISCVLALKAGKKNNSGSLNMKGRNQRSTTPSEIFSNSSLPKHWRSQFNPNNMARYTGHSWD